MRPRIVETWASCAGEGIKVMRSIMDPRQYAVIDNRIITIEVADAVLQVFAAVDESTQAKLRGMSFLRVLGIIFTAINREGARNNGH